MHAFLYKSIQNIPATVLNSQYLIQILPNEHGNIKIEEIRNVQKFFSILPPKKNINYGIIVDAHKMTIDAQNAFLKTLEEPPSQTEIYLVTGYPDDLLPTILSRVEIILDNQLFSYTSASLENSRSLWKKLQTAEVGERLAVIDEVGFDRESFLHFLSDLEFILHQNLPADRQISHLYSLLVQTKLYTQSNCNMRLVLDYFAYSL